MKTLRIIVCAMLLSNGAFAQFENYFFYEDGGSVYMTHANGVSSDTSFVFRDTIMFDFFADSIFIRGRISGQDAINWNAAAAQASTVFSWGNHSSYGYVTASSTTTFTNKSGNVTQWTNDAGYLTGITSGQVTTALGYVPLSTEVDGSTTNELAPAGTVSMFAGASAPEGYLMCNGSAVSRTTYAALFAIVGTTYGSGDGSTTFNLPDLRQRFPIGVAASGTGSTLGGTGGTIDHLHTVDPPSTTSSQPTGIENVTNTLAVEEVAGDAHTHAVDIAQFNSGTANPPFIALNFIIKH